MAAFTGEEVFLAELINRARSDPQAEGARLGMDLTDGLTAEEIALLGPVEPLALDLSLTLAARAHSLDMASRGFLDHVNPEGLNPTDRVRAAGYSGVAGESIAAGQPAVERAYETWMASVANRLNILSLFADFDAGFHYDQFGAGYTTEGEPQDPHYTALFGDPGAGSTAWLLGVVYADSDGDEFYSVGEGAGGVRIDVAAAGDPATIVATYTTDEAGNYQLRLGDGSWVVTFTDIGTGNLVIKQVATGGQNVKLDALLAEFDPPAGNGDGGGDDGQGDGGDGDGDGGDGGDGNGDGGDDGGSAQDDHADDGDYANASLITLSDAGEGAAAGVIGAGTDTDLLYFTATAAGELSVTLDCSSGDLVGAILLRSESGLPLAAESADAGGGAVVLSWSVPAGEQYFLVIASADLVSTGDYTLHLAMPSSSDDGGDGNGDGDSGDGDGTDDGDGDGDDGGGDGSGGDGGDDGDGGGGGDDDGSGGDDGSSGDEDPPVDVASDGSGAVTIVRTDEEGHPILYFQQDDGSWSSLDLIGQVGGPIPEGRFATFVHPSNGSSSVVSATGSGLAVYSQDAFGQWQVRNLSVELGAAPIASKPVTFMARTGLVFAAGLDADGHLVVYRQTGGLDANGETGWTFEDLSADHLAAQGLSMPGLEGNTLIAYVTTWNGLTLAGLDNEGNVQAAWWAPGMEKWTLANLSRATGAPRYVGTISAYLTPWQGINIAGTDENGDLAVVWWVPGFGGQWRLSKLNQMLDGPRLEQATLASWVTPWGGLNISGLTGAGDVVVYWWAPDADGWHIATLSDAVPEVERPVRGLIGHTTSGGTVSVMGLTESHELVRYWWEPGGTWQGEYLSVES